MRSLSDKALLEVIGTFLKEKRIEQNLTQDAVAIAAGISRSTLSLLEKGESVTTATLIRVLRVIDQIEILSVFQLEPIISPIQLAKLEQQKRTRAREKKEYPRKPNW